MFYNPYSDIHNDSENKCDHNDNEEQLLRDWQRLAKKPTHESYEEFDDYNDNILASPIQIEAEIPDEILGEHGDIREEVTAQNRPTRNRTRNPRYFNDNMVNNYDNVPTNSCRL